MGLSYVQTFPRHRCDLRGIGVAEQRDPRKYQWDNANRAAGLLFQYTLEGVGRFASGRRSWPMTAGTAFLTELPSTTRYGLPPSPAPRWRFVWAIFAGDAALDHGRRILSRYGPVLRLAVASTPIRLLLDLHRRVLDAGRRGGLDELTVTIDVHRFLLELDRSLSTPADLPPPDIDAAIRAIHERFADPKLDVDALAAVSGYSRFHFSRRFREHAGLSPYQYLVRVRMRHALSLLTGSDLAIKQIALRCGYADASRFCAAFGRQMRMTPGQVRRQHRGQRLDEIVTM